MNPSVQTDMAGRLFAAAAGGDVQALTTILSGMSSVDVRNDRGWTALMMAARQGHVHIVKALMEKGCDTDVINSSGQTANDIAKFWNFPEVVKVLEEDQTPASFSQSLGGHSDDKNFFGTEFLDRAAHKRKDKAWLKEALTKKDTTILLFKNLDVLVVPQVDHSTTEPKGSSRLYRARYLEIKEFADFQENQTAIFLGLDRRDQKEAADGSAWFAVDVPNIQEAEVSKLNAHASFLQSFPGSLQLAPGDAGVYAQARSVLAWHDRYAFCSTCGKQTTQEDGGYKRDCTDTDCRSRKGVHNTCYPRVDPTVIMAVVSPDGRRLLLGRGPRFPRGMYSCLAGFVEPGETVEAACRREVVEEAGVQVGRVEYHSCQPWPMPSSLMLGCMAHATSDSMQVDKDELEDARWFSRHDVINMLNNRHPERFFIPPEQAIAHVLIRTWVNMTSNL